ncbi:MAG: hypothetical protein J5634_02795 [Bacilli bacterium]|nr:hypothetical protein [Bacilli bacterium]
MKIEQIRDILTLENKEKYEKLRDKYLIHYNEQKEKLYTVLKSGSSERIKQFKENLSSIEQLIKQYDMKTKWCKYHNCKHIWFISKYGTYCLKCHMKPKAVSSGNKPKLISNTNASRSYMRMIKCTTSDQVNEYINEPEFTSINYNNITPKVANYITLVLKERYGELDSNLFKYLFENELQKGTHCQMFNESNPHRK